MHFSENIAAEHNQSVSPDVVIRRLDDFILAYVSLTPWRTQTQLRPISEPWPTGWETVF